MYPSIILAFFTALFLSVPVMSFPVEDTVIEARSGTLSGEATYFAPGLGACGYTDPESKHLTAISSSVFRQSLCNKMIKITYPKTGKSLTVPVRDSCPGCAENHLDLSPSAFTALGANEADGVIQIKFNKVW